MKTFDLNEILYYFSWSGGKVFSIKRILWMEKIEQRQSGCKKVEKEGRKGRSEMIPKNEIVENTIKNSANVGWHLWISGELFQAYKLLTTLQKQNFLLGGCIFCVCVLSLFFHFQSVVPFRFCVCVLLLSFCDIVSYENTYTIFTLLPSTMRTTEILHTLMYMLQNSFATGTIPIENEWMGTANEEKIIRRYGVMWW